MSESLVMMDGRIVTMADVGGDSSWFTNDFNRSPSLRGRPRSLIDVGVLSGSCRGPNKAIRSTLPSLVGELAMTVNPEEFLESRVPTPSELAAFIKERRERHKWTQATLAELAGLTE